MFIIGFSEVGHLLLHGRRHKGQIALATLDATGRRESHKTGNGCFGRHNCTVLNDATIL